MIVDQKLNKGFKGAYLIDGTNDGVKLGTSEKPNFFRRVIFKLLLGWKWVDIIHLKAKNNK